MASYECRGKKKLWSVRFTIIEDCKEKTKRLSGFKRKKDAELAYHNFIEEYSKTQHNKNNSDIKYKGVLKMTKKFKQHTLIYDYI